MPPLLSRFLDPSFVSLKICGVTTASDAEELVKRNVDAVGLNFWPNSKRYLQPEHADFLTSLSGRILRVGVFVNAEPAFAISLVERGWIDVIQLHGDEGPDVTTIYQKSGLPFFKAIGVKSQADLNHAAEFGAHALLLDAAAPGVYGGTGEVFDWNVAHNYREAHPETPIILAGGIVPENAAAAAKTVRPCALDVASGAETRPGVKDFEKVDALLEAIHRAAQG